MIDHATITSGIPIHLGQEEGLAEGSCLPGDLRVACRHPRQQLGVVEERAVKVHVEVAVQDVMHGSSDSLTRSTKQPIRQNDMRRGVPIDKEVRTSSFSSGKTLHGFISRTEKDTRLLLLPSQKPCGWYM